MNKYRLLLIAGVAMLFFATPAIAQTTTRSWDDPFVILGVAMVGLTAFLVLSHIQSSAKDRKERILDREARERQNELLERIAARFMPGPPEGEPQTMEERSAAVQYAVNQLIAGAETDAKAAEAAKAEVEAKAAALLAAEKKNHGLVVDLDAARTARQAAETAKQALEADVETARTALASANTAHADEVARLTHDLREAEEDLAEFVREHEATGRPAKKAKEFLQRRTAA